jgi:membrane protein YdbS with pleckstrin-like domain
MFVSANSAHSFRFLPRAEFGMKDPSQHDRQWLGYHPRAMAPAVTLTAVASLVVWTANWYLDDFSDFAERVGSWAVFAMAWAVWPALIAVFLYRTVLIMYRRTDRTLVVEFGFLYRPVAAIPLKDVTAVVVGGGWLARRLGVGWVEVQLPERRVRMTGVRRPLLLAEKLREAVAALRGNTEIGGGV